MENRSGPSQMNTAIRAPSTTRPKLLSIPLTPALGGALSLAVSAAVGLFEVAPDAVLELVVLVVLAATVVAPVTTTIVVPSMTVVDPEIGKFEFRGIVVGPAMIKRDEPSIMTVSWPLILPAVREGESGTVVWEGITR